MVLSDFLCKITYTVIPIPLGSLSNSSTVSLMRKAQLIVLAVSGPELPVARRQRQGIWFCYWM